MPQKEKKRGRSEKGSVQTFDTNSIRFCSGSSRRCFFPRLACDSKFDTCVQAPMCNSPAIHFKVMVVSSLNRRAISTSFASPLRRRRNSVSVQFNLAP